MGRRVLLTGGAGFIGSHTYVALVEAGLRGHDPRQFRECPPRCARPAGADHRRAGAGDRGRHPRRPPIWTAPSRAQAFDAVVHFAARKSIAEGEADPLGYYQSNCGGLMNVVAAMRVHGVRAIVFSSSAAVYGNAETVPITEETPVAPENTYARTKVFGEEFLQAVAAGRSRLSQLGILRYFNPVGAHGSGLIGEDPSQPPTNLVPVIARVAQWQLHETQCLWRGLSDTGRHRHPRLHPCRGSGPRPCAVARCALGRGQSHLVNLGTGRGHSVLEVLKTY